MLLLNSLFVNQIWFIFVSIHPITKMKWYLCVFLSVCLWFIHKKNYSTDFYEILHNISGSNIGLFPFQEGLYRALFQDAQPFSEVTTCQNLKLILCRAFNYHGTPFQYNGLCAATGYNYNISNGTVSIYNKL